MGVYEKPVVVVTGCSSGGIGHALAIEFAARGCLVVTTARSLASISDLQDDQRFFVQQLDVSSDESVRHALSTVLEKFGRIDIVVNNAAVPCVGPMAEVPLSMVHDTFNTNFFGCLRLIQGVVPHMALRKKGKIVNIGSVAALAPTPWAGSYIASKAALHALTDTLRLELRPFGIDVINVVPGAIRSNIGSSALTTFNRIPELKMYKHFEEVIRARAIVSKDPNSTPSKEFAKKTVNEVLKENPRIWISLGHRSTLFAIFYHLPLFIRDFFIRRKFGMV